MDILVKICVIVAIVLFVIGQFISNGAPQECAWAGIALSIGVLPYLLFKVGYCAEMLENQRKIIRLLEPSKKES
jgi:hypothetical protein